MNATRATVGVKSYLFDCVERLVADAGDDDRVHVHLLPELLVVRQIQRLVVQLLSNWGRMEQISEGETERENLDETSSRWLSRLKAEEQPACICVLALLLQSSKTVQDCGNVACALCVCVCVVPHAQ